MHVAQIASYLPEAMLAVSDKYSFGYHFAIHPRMRSRIITTQSTSSNVRNIQYTPHHSSMFHLPLAASSEICMRAKLLHNDMQPLLPYIWVIVRILPQPSAHIVCWIQDKQARLIKVSWFWFNRLDPICMATCVVSKSQVRSWLA